MTTYQRKGSVFERFGVKQVINGEGWKTMMGGSIMPPEVVQAMAEATEGYVHMDELNEKAGEAIARITGAEAGLVTNGCAGALTMQVAACMTGVDEGKIAQLPDTTGMKNEVIIQRAHRNRYDGHYRIPGASLVEIGINRSTAAWELEAAINENTVAVAFVQAPFLPQPLPLPEVVDIAHRRGVPVVMDAADEVPPIENLTRFIGEGVDMVAFSGGKGIRGPQATGILCGRGELIEAALLNRDNWNSPHAGICRTMKVSKELIVGLVTALELFLERDHEAEARSLRAKSQVIVSALEGIPGVVAGIEHGGPNRHSPHAVINFEPSWKGMSAKEVKERLTWGDPPIYIVRGGYLTDELYIEPVGLLDGDEEEVARRLRELLTIEQQSSTT